MKARRKAEVNEAAGMSVWLTLWKASRAMEHFDRRSIARLGLCATDFAVLELLLHKGPMGVTAMGRKVLLTSGSITTAVQRLEREGWVTRRGDASDGRMVRVELTSRGRQFIEGAFREHRRTIETAVAVLDRDERAELVRLLKKVGRHAEQLGAERGTIGAGESAWD